ncbi:uncharacterized protein LOC112638978 [Camponotus floridanus]|uniref:uncharacterized protein LOC112638978 n=1 Tax=Camponotus floridanus TaxID=104421 RepID=UPI000DC67130|nr:uncharacterized protein LOC112638978 [Camponotus floridanus]
MLEYADSSNKNKEELLVQQEQQRTHFEFTYFNMISRCDSLIEHFDKNNPQPSTSHVDGSQGDHASTHRESRIKLPKIELPVFTGSYDDWYSYQDVFEKLIYANEGLSEIEKFHYLRSSLKDKAAEIRKSIETITDNYNDAWASVKERFDNKRWIIHKHVQAIFDAPILIKENHSRLRELLDAILKHLRALKALKRPTESWDDLIIHIVVSKLDPATSKAWETSLPDKDVPNLKSLIDFLSKRCQALETIFSKLSTNQSTNNSKSIKSKGPSVSNLATSNVSCPQCKEGHYLYYCETFLKLPIEKRISVVRKAHLCINCLRTNSHLAKDCNSGACRKCSKKHNTLLHLPNAVNDNKVSIDDVASNKSTSQSKASTQPIVTQCVAAHHSLGIILSTAIVHVFDYKNDRHSCRVLLDSGSQMNFITQEFADKLRIKEQCVEIAITGVVKGTIQAKKMINVHIQSRFNNFNEKVECIILPQITQQLPQALVFKQDIAIPKHIKLADPNFNIPSNIDMLIGAELFWKLICAGQIKSSRTQPILQKTLLGWIISGPTPSNISSSSSSASNCLAVTTDLNRALSRFWEIDHLGSSTSLTPEEQACERLFQDTVRQYLQLGHMREVTSHLESTHKNYYLPHHAVYKETSTTTKLRVVFDGSCKSSSGISLNDTMMVGPTIQDDLFSILTRFRTFKCALTADVTKIYRQVLVDPNQTSLQRILWRDSMNEPIRTFELLTLTYGTAAASFLAIRCLRKLAEDNAIAYPKGSKVALRDFYVDDLVTDANTLQEALVIKSETSKLLIEGGFKLRKWTSNEPSLRDNQFLDSQKEFVLSCDKEDETRTLGLVWNCKTDHFKFSNIASLPPLSTPSKRAILSRIALIFDPLGLLGPTTVIAKIIMQDLWRLKIDWDESLPLDVNTKWKRYEAELPMLRNIFIPRRVIELDDYVKLEIHGFADASEIAYGACVYVRVTDANGKHSTRLLCSKGRVAPLKALSIPRLELCAALLLAQLIDKVLKCLTVKIDSVYLWTDSTIVLAWLQSCSRTWTTFVANRVGEIQQLTTPHHWHHVSSQDNPADLYSRGVTPTSLLQSQLWWSGPTWLNLNKGSWPQFPFVINKQEIPEYKATAITTIATKQPFDIFERYSNFLKLTRVVAYIFRFFNNLMRKIKPSRSYPLQPGADNSVSPDEINHATQVLVKLVQRLHFPKELELLIKQQDLNKSSPIIRLNPFVDESGVLRVGGRLKLSYLPYTAKYPALLPGHHPFSRLIIIHEHERHFHAGPQATLSAVRQSYWLVSARDVVRQITRKCITCFRSSPKTSSTLMGNLPRDRITVPKRVFEKCGVDYAGAKRELSELAALFNEQRDQQQISDYMAIKGINWHCIPPRAPHHGGLWEAAVKGAKRHLIRVTKEAHLRYEELETLLIQVEAILNSRPLTPMSSDPSDLTSLTLGHFLIGSPLTSYPEPSIEKLPINRLSRWQHVEQIRQHFWQRWTREYLHHCQQRNKWIIKGKPMHVGQMVLLKEDNNSPLTWPLAKIIEVHPGDDNLIRTVTVRTAKGIYKRPITRLCSLPFEI